MKANRIYIILKKDQNQGFTGDRLMTFIHQDLRYGELVPSLTSEVKLATSSFPPSG